MNQTFSNVFGFLLILAALHGFSQRASGYALRIVNTSDNDLKHHPVVLNLDRLPEKFRNGNLLLMKPDGTSIPAQVDDIDGDEIPDELVFQVHLNSQSAAQVRLKKAKPKQADTGLELSRTKNSVVMENKFLRCIVSEEQHPRTSYSSRNGPERSGSHLPGMIVYDQTNNKTLLDSVNVRGKVFSSEAKKRAEAQVVATGPVRTIVQQRWKHEDVPIHIAQRFVLYKGTNGFKFKSIIDNDISENTYNPGERPGPWGLKAFMNMYHGELLVSNLHKTDIYKVNHWTSNRNNILYTNRKTGYAFGYNTTAPDGARWTCGDSGRPTRVRTAFR